MIRRLYDALYRANNGFAEGVARVSSWRFWVTVVTIGPLLAITVDSWRNHGFNPASTIMTFVVLMLTIQTSIDAQGQRLNQAQVQLINEKQDAQFVTLLSSMAAQTVAIREELDRTRDRDASMIARDEVIYDLVHKLVDAAARANQEGVT